MSKISIPATKGEVSQVVPDLKEGASATEAARFIADFTSELSHLARASDLDLLTYLLDMARLEAIRVVQSGEP